MKKWFAFILLLSGTAAHAQKIPVAVKDSFAKHFSDIKSVKWDKEKEGYEANFKRGGKKMAVTFDAKAKLQEVETEIAVKELPAGVITYLEKNHKGAKIKDAAIIMLANGESRYEANIGGNDLLFDAAGKYLKTVKD